MQLGVASDDAEFEPEVKAKATEVVAKKAGVSTRTFERGKKILEEASEDDKQKLREGKTSISRVYQEIVGENKPQPPAESIVKQDSERDIHNKEGLLAILERFIEEELYCPSCGNTMFECSKCHRTLRELLAKYKADKL
jgi:predicted RNA-binding Zn-ribbon protein involved in translation (DUF1610 family)